MAQAFTDEHLYARHEDKRIDPVEKHAWNSVRYFREQDQAEPQGNLSAWILSMAW